MAFDSKALLREIKEGIVNLAKEQLSEYVFEAGKDATDFINEIKDDLERWVTMLKEGKLSKSDFEFLVNAKQDLLEMKALKQAGLAKIKLDEFKISSIDILTKTVFKLIGL